MLSIRSTLTTDIRANRCELRRCLPLARCRRGYLLQSVASRSALGDGRDVEKRQGTTTHGYQVLFLELRQHPAYGFEPQAQVAADFLPRQSAR